MRMATDLSVRLGLLPPSALERMHRLLIRAGLPVQAPDLGVERYLQWMGRDKKAEAGEIRFVLLESMGRAVVWPAPDELVGQVLEAAVGRGAPA
jgi:3-dehydroquinate synthase